MLLTLISDRSSPVYYHCHLHHGIQRQTSILSLPPSSWYTKTNQYIITATFIMVYKDKTHCQNISFWRVQIPHSHTHTPNHPQILPSSPDKIVVKKGVTIAQLGTLLNPLPCWYHHKKPRFSKTTHGRWWTLMADTGFRIHHNFNLLMSSLRKSILQNKQTLREKKKFSVSAKDFTKSNRCNTKQSQICLSIPDLS